MKIIQFLLILAFSSHVYAYDEEKFKQCVRLKELTLTITNQADKGVSRRDLKAKVGSHSIDGLIDFVYDFRGVKTNQEIMANQMNNCLRLNGIK